ncbi:YvcK family protein [Planomicrobium sp. CPCC 101079]|uniref:gluconeogenesis factor YvcK family protein n=1 Tax=Planomicrobium sp. CPCC 101079 TaxID=2599618 RepID=UPI0011B56BC4|nr:YvcK family protein [Planomicrobium sp. CPCC 101079]TWT00098.1 YvcK family protein [Planomicrobium sp. CPCC 101079]
MEQHVRRKRIVIIGGGTGLSTLLRGLKKFPLDLTAIVTVADDGGSSGRLRDDLDIPPPGDIRNVMAALSDAEPLVAEMFQHRFKGSLDLGGHSLGNLMLAALTEITGDFSLAVREMSRVLNVNGTVLPAANQLVTLYAELEDGSMVKGESKIPAYLQKIKRVYLEPHDVKTLPDTIAAIRNADIIVVGPGSLYTSILPNLLVKDIKKAVIASKAKKIYICNLMTQAGETYRYTAADHVRALYDHVEEGFLDAILLDKVEIPQNIAERYKKERAWPVEYDEERLRQMGLRIFKEDIANILGEAVRHEPLKVAEWLFEYAGGLAKEDSTQLYF